MYNLILCREDDRTGSVLKYSDFSDVYCKYKCACVLNNSGIIRSSNHHNAGLQLARSNVTATLS